MWKTRQLTDKAEIKKLLQRDRGWAAYPIGDLDEGLFERCEWHVSEAKPGELGLCLLFTGFEPPALFTMGDVRGVAAVLATSLQAPIAFFAAKPGHIAAIRRSYSLESPERMVRMTVNIERFQAVDGKCRRLGPADIGAVKQLYSVRMPPCFSEEHLASGVFYGIDAGHELVSVAGTHLVSPKQRIAAVGNVLTRPDCRGRGYATVVSSAVTEELLAGGMEVVLNVGEKNEPARKVYEKLGFKSYCRFIEVLGKRK